MNSIPLETLAANINIFGWKILNLIKTNDHATFNEVRNDLGLSQEKSYKEIARLEGALLIISNRDPKDQRSILFSLTTYGEQLLELQNSK